MADLNIAEILHPDGAVKFRYARVLSDDGTRWIRHGLFRAYHPDGTLASDGHYADGVESGPWKDFHPNGQLAAEGLYVNGEEAPGWRYWDADGREEAPS